MEEWPQATNDRSEPGHWEADTVACKTGSSCLITLTCRKSRQLLSLKIPRKTSTLVHDGMIPLLRMSNRRTVMWRCQPRSIRVMKVLSCSLEQRLVGFDGSKRNLTNSLGRQPENLFLVKRCMYGADSIICWSTTAIRATLWFGTVKRPSLLCHLNRCVLLLRSAAWSSLSMLKYLLRLAISLSSFLLPTLHGCAARMRIPTVLSRSIVPSLLTVIHSILRFSLLLPTGLIFERANVSDGDLPLKSFLINCCT